MPERLPPAPARHWRRAAHVAAGDRDGTARGLSNMVGVRDISWARTPRRSRLWRNFPRRGAPLPRWPPHGHLFQAPARPRRARGRPPNSGLVPLVVAESFTMSGLGRSLAARSRFGVKAPQHVASHLAAGVISALLVLWWSSAPSPNGGGGLSEQVRKLTLASERPWCLRGCERAPPELAFSGGSPTPEGRCGACDAAGLGGS